MRPIVDWWRRPPLAGPDRQAFALEPADAKRIRALFDGSWYLSRYPEVAGSDVDPFEHYVQYGAAAGYECHPMFWSAWYLERYPDIAAAGMNPVWHYLTHGATEKRDPNPLFDTRWYLQQYPEVEANSRNPLLDFIERSSTEGAVPGPLFSDELNWTSDRAEATRARVQYDRFIGRPALTPLPGWLKFVRAGLSKSGSQAYGDSRFTAAATFFRGARRLAPSRNDELLIALAKAEIQCGNFDRALECFCSLCLIAGPSEPQVEIVSRPIVHQGVMQERSIAVVTSVMPKRIEAQQAAVRSWKNAGLSVVSVNTSAEADDLRALFPDVTFRTTDQVRVDSRSRPLVPIHTLIETVSQEGHDICGIVNSDIEFRGGDHFVDAVRSHVASSLVFGCRIDFADREFDGGRAFRHGYDFFFWSRENSSLFDQSDMTLGMPWWDFWMPLHAHAQGLKIKRLATSSMIHINHPLGYNQAGYVHYGRLFAKTLADVYGRWDNENPPADHAFLHRLSATAAALPASTDVEADSRRIGIFCELVNCVIDTISEKLIVEPGTAELGVLEPF